LVSGTNKDASAGIGTTIAGFPADEVLNGAGRSFKVIRIGVGVNGLTGTIGGSCAKVKEISTTNERK